MSEFLVLGATGHVGRPLVETLLAQGHTVRAASRGGQAVGGAKGVAFDYRDTASVAAALDGVDGVYVLSPGGEMDVVGLLTPVISEAARRGTKVVLQTAIGVDADDHIPLRQAELLLERSGAPFVILRPNWFADNFATYWGHDLAQGVIRVPAGEGRTSFVDVRDIAASAAGALTSSRFDGQAFALTGPEGLSYSEAAAVLSRATGRTIAYTPIDDATFIANLTQAGVAADYAQLLAAIFHPVREGWTAGVTDAVERLSGRAPRSLDTWAKDHLSALQPA